MKILVTGGAGFIGSHLVEALMSRGDKVYVVDDLSSGAEKNLVDYHGLYIEDCRDFRVMDEIMAEVKPDVVYHLAAYPAENKGQFSPMDISSRGYEAFITTLTAGIKHNVKRYIVTSSIAAYGKIRSPFFEKDRCEPEDIYGILKLAMEETLKVMAKVHDFEYVITRPHNVYGPRQSFTDPYRNVIAIWMNNIMRGESYAIYGDGGNVRCYTYIDDLVDGLVRCLGAHTGEIYNLGASKAYSLRHLSDILHKVTGGPEPLYLPGRPQEVSEAVSNHQKAIDHLKYETSVSLEEGIRRTWEYAKKLGPQERRYTEIEIPNDKMPKNWRV